MLNMKSSRPLFTACLFAIAALPTFALSPEEAPRTRSAQDDTGQIIVKYRDRVSAAAFNSVTALPSVRALSQIADIELAYVREMSTGAHVLRLPQTLPLSQVEAIAQRLAADPDIEYAEPDYRVYPTLTPNDPQFPLQWHLTDPLGGINATAAWDITTGSANTVIAIIDTGRTPHPDLDARMLPGYDFITDPLMANDLDARDADPNDPGDWVNAADKVSPKFSNCTVENSSWHGTLVAGVLAAATQNGVGLAGIDWAGRILPVRSLGKCGGQSSDTADAMAWAAGFTVPGIPDNPNPAKVLNLSLGSANACSASYRAVIPQILAAGKIIIAAAGNDNNSADHSPASCVGVINVAAIGRSGNKASYSNFGPKITLAAPGGENGSLLTLSNTGTTVQANPTTTGTSGTSFSAPVVSGIVALMVALRPDLDSVAVTRILAASVRPFPDSTCDTSICGAGIIDAAAAVRATRDQALGVATFVGFADADVGKANPDSVLKVTNLSATPTTINPILGLSNTTDFSITSTTCLGLPINSNATCNIVLRFTPSGKDTRQGELSFTTSDNRSYRVSLSGFAYSSANVSQQTAGTSGAPAYIAKAPDDTYWYTQSTANRVARMTPAGQVTEFSLPSTAANPFDITAGSDGNMWFTELDGGRIGRITLNGVITEFSLPNVASRPRGIALGPDGNIWFTELAAAKIGRITPTGVITEFDIPWTNATPRGITAGPDGNLWFTDSSSLALGRVTPAGIMTRFPVPGALGEMRGITTGPDRNLWFTELRGNRIGRMTTAGVFTEFPLPRPGTGALGITVGPDGAVWYTGNDVSRAGRVDTTTGQITEYRLPSAGSSPVGIVTGPNNVMWVANNATSVNKIARLSIAGVSGANVYSDIWWAGTAENGWGMSIQQHGNVQFNALYVYDSTGKPVWYVMPNGNWNSDFTTFAGPVYQPTSSPLSNYNTAVFVVGAPVGNVSLNFTSPSAANMTYTIDGVSGQKSIQRQVFGRGTSPINIGDMWWGGQSQDGWGVNLTQQAGIVFAAWYTYGPDGRATWYVMSDGTWNGNTYSGAFFSTLSSPWLGVAYDASKIQVVPAGTMSFNFSDASNAVMTYSFTAGPLAGTTQMKPISRLPY